MKPLELYSETVRPVGGLHGDAVRRTIGKPDLPFWHVVLREALQNSWDARVADSIEFTLELRHLSADQQHALRIMIGSTPPPGLAELVSAASSPPPLEVLLVADRNTRGLGGPTRSDIETGSNESIDFRSFAFDMGRDPGRAVGGGTYGFGKAVLYLASKVSTVAMYTQVKTPAGQIEPRFMILSVAERATDRGKQYTGRHWWGTLNIDVPDSVAPIVGPEARELAHSLGMDAFLGPVDTGSALAILAPHDPSGTAEVETDGESDVLAQLRDAILRWAWPHLATTSGEPTIHFRVMRDGNELDPPRVSDDTEIARFAQAYREAEAFIADPHRESSLGTELHSLPKDVQLRRTGVLALRRALEATPTGEERFRDTVALMRRPRFVVAYQPIPSDPSGAYTAGVFIAANDRDADFAKQEPVTHEAWTPEQGGGGANKKPVWRTLLDIKAVAKRDARIEADALSTMNLGGMAHLSRRLGDVLAGIMGPGGETHRSSPGKSSGEPAEISITLLGNVDWVDAEDVVTVDFPVAVRSRPATDLTKWTVTVEPRIVLEGGQVEEGVADPTLATVEGWRVGDELLVRGPDATVIDLAGDARASDLARKEIAVRVRHDPHVAVTLVVKKRKTS